MPKDCSEIEKSFSKVFQLAPVPMMISTLKEDVFLDVNENFLKITGFKREEIIGKTIEEIGLLDHDTNQAITEKLLKEGGLRDLEAEFFVKSGETRIAKISAEIIRVNEIDCVLVAAEDITEKKLAEENIRQHAVQTERIVDCLPDPTFAIDKEGKVIAWNQAIETLTGIYKNEIIGKGNFEYALPFYGERIPIMVDLALKSYPKHEEKYSQFKKKNGGIIAEAFIPKLGLYLSGKASPLFDDEGNLVGAIETMRDITEKKRLAYREIQEEKFQALGKLTSGFVHNINNLLGAVLGYIELVLESKWPLNEKQKEWLGKSLMAARDIREIITRFREFYMPHNIEKDLPSIQINNLVTQIVELAKPKWKDESERDGKNIRVLVNLDPNLPLIKASESEVREMLMNVFLNALDAIAGDNGNIVINTFFSEFQVIAEIKDDGIGMNKETLKQCTDPLFTTKGEQGTGMGLHTVSGLMQRHRGSLDITSALGKGTSIKLCFPAVKGSGCSIINPEAKRRGKCPSKKILCIDDDPIILQVEKDTFEEDGHEVTAAEGGLSGVENFSQALEKELPFDLVLTDVGMGSYSGKKVVTEIRKIEKEKEIFPPTPIIVFTGWGEDAETRGSKEFEGCHIVSKPNLLELKLTIQSIFKT